MRLLIIEDEKDIALPLQKFLQKNGYAVDYAMDGRAGLEMAQINQYDCILLDLNLPEIDGLEISKRLRDGGNTTPIIMVTARSQIYNKLDGFKKGTDDYITKPFDSNELVARIQALIRRSSQNKLEALEFSGYKLIPERNELITARAKHIELTNKETGVLEYLIRNKDRVVSSEELLEHVWDDQIDTFTDTVKTHIKTLRQKIGHDQDLIRTIRGKGYSLGNFTFTSS
jgi:DNA-binding response OmpR family regulator